MLCLSAIVDSVHVADACSATLAHCSVTREKKQLLIASVKPCKMIFL